MAASGFDTAAFTSTYAASTVTWNGTTATVTNAAEGTDIIDGVGKLEFSGGTTVWLVSPTSEYTTLTQLFDGNTANGEVDDNDVVYLGPGNYGAFDFPGGASSGNDGITVHSSGVTIRGAGDDASGANAISSSMRISRSRRRSRSARERTISQSRISASATTRRGTMAFPPMPAWMA